MSLDTAIKPCRLHEYSISVRRAMKEQLSVSASFPLHLNKAIKNIIDNPNVSSFFSSGGVSYLSAEEMTRVDKKFMFTFPITSEEQALIVFGSRLPFTLLELCFGADTINFEQDNLSDLDELPKVARFLLQKLCTHITEAWFRVWHPIFTLPKLNTIKHGNGDQSIHARHDYIKSQFFIRYEQGALLPSQLENADQEGDFIEDELALYMPVNPLCGRLLDHQRKADPSDCDQKARELEQMRLMKRVMASTVSLKAELAYKSFPLATISALRPGDVIPIDKPEEAVIRIGKAPVLTTTVGQRSDQIVLKVISSCT